MWCALALRCTCTCRLRGAHGSKGVISRRHNGVCVCVWKWEERESSPPQSLILKVRQIFLFEKSGIFGPFVTAFPPWTIKGGEGVLMMGHHFFVLRVLGFRFPSLLFLSFWLGFRSSSSSPYLVRFLFSCAWVRPIWPRL